MGGSKVSARHGAPYVSVVAWPPRTTLFGVKTEGAPVVVARLGTMRPRAAHALLAVKES